MNVDVGRYEAFGRCVDRCESFIERRLAVALLFSEAFTFAPFDGIPHAVARDVMGVVLLQQAKVDQYRVDFTMMHPRGLLKLVIECDGHEFHDGDRDAAARDRARDRHLLSLGWTTSRFTGREVVRDAMQCAVDAHRLVVRSVPNLDATLSAAARSYGSRAPRRQGQWDERLARCNGDWDAEMAVAREANEAQRRRHGMGGSQ